MSTPVYPWTKEEAERIKALYADPGGRLVLEMIIERLGWLNGASFMAGDPYMTAFTEGRRFVARELLTAINVPTEALIKEEPNGRTRTLTATERAERAAAGQPAYSPVKRRW